MAQFLERQMVELHLLRRKKLLLIQEIFFFPKTTQTRLIQVQPSDLRFRIYDLRLWKFMIYSEGKLQLL